MLINLTKAKAVAIIVWRLCFWFFLFNVILVMLFGLLGPAVEAKDIDKITFLRAPLLPLHVRLNTGGLSLEQGRAFNVAANTAVQVFNDEMALEIGSPLFVVDSIPLKHDNSFVPFSTWDLLVDAGRLSIAKSWIIPPVVRNLVVERNLQVRFAAFDIDSIAVNYLDLYHVQGGGLAAEQGGIVLNSKQTCFRSLNGDEFGCALSLDVKKNSYVLERILAHEFGHSLGLGHDDDRGSLNPVYEEMGNESLSLSKGNKDSLRRILR